MRVVARRSLWCCLRSALGVGADVVHVVRLVVESGDEGYGVVQRGHHVRERVAEEAADPDGHVDARAAELVRAGSAPAGQPAGRLVPVRPYAEQREHLGHVVARGAHAGRAPDGQADRVGVGSGVGQVPLEQRVGHGLAGLPGQPGRHGARVDRVEVPTGRQHVHQAAQRRAARAGRDEPAVEGVQGGGDLVRRSLSAGALPRWRRT